MDETEFIEKLIKEMPTSLFIALVFILWQKLSRLKEDSAKILDILRRIEAKIGMRRKEDAED
jgi:hypothetical protein